MATRSGAGTGVIVSLVVFILTTVFLLVLTIVFYVGRNDAIEQQANSEGALAQYVSDAERASPRFRELEAVSEEDRSVAMYLSNRHDDLMRYLNGDSASTYDALRVEMESYGVETGNPLVSAIEGMRRDLDAKDRAIDSRKDEIAALDQAIEQRDDRIRQLRDDHQRELDSVSQEIDRYKNAGDELSDDVRRTIDDLNDALIRLEDQQENERATLEDQIDRANQDLVLLRTRVDEYETILNGIRIRSQRPDTLVDAAVIEVDATREQIFINRGERDGIVLGMTFEIYDDVTSMVRNGQLQRGRGSVQVVRVFDSTATCKITRDVPGRPIVRNNIAVNAIYDPTFSFKFLVHGRFDFDGDGRPSDAEANYIRELIRKWGGVVETGDVLPGDTDFLIVGRVPPMPAPLPPDADETKIQVWAARRAARERYEQLRTLADEAQIPVLDAPALFTLIGHTN